MEKKSKEDKDINTVDVTQGTNTFQPSEPNTNNFKEQNFIETELKHRPDNLFSEDICLHSNHDQFGVIKVKSVSICLVCKSVVHFSSLDPCYKNHLNSYEHKLNNSELFKQCFQDPGFNSVNKIYNYISTNSLIDFSSASKVFTDEVNDICLVCKHKIPSFKTNKAGLIGDVLCHLKDIKHFRNLQDNFSWTCNLLPRGNLTFYKTLFYCSACEESINNCNLIKTAVNHIETKHQEDCLSLGLEQETVCHETKTSHDSDSMASDCDRLEEDSDDLFSNCDDGSFYFEDDIHTSNVSEVNLIQIQDKKEVIEKITKNDQHEGYFYVCIECGGNIEIIEDDFDMSVQSHLLSHEREEGDALVIPKHNRCAERIFPSFGKQVETFVSQSSSTNSGTENEHKEVFIKELSNCGKAKDIPKDHKNQGLKQTTVKPKFPIKATNITKNKFFSDLADCLPANFHKDLHYITIKSKQIHCELCICSLGSVSNVFDSSFILYSHLSSVNHKNLIDDAEIRSENKPKIVQSLSHNKREVKPQASSLVTGEKLITNNRSVPVAVDNIPTNLSSNNVHAKPKDFNKTDINNSLTLNSQMKNEIIPNFNIHSKLLRQTVIPVRDTSCTSSTVQKPCDLGSISSYNISEATKQTDIAHEIDLSKQKTSNLLPITDLLKDSNLKVHHGFFKPKHDKIYCCLCSSDVGDNQADLTDHIKGITHKVQFLSQLKKFLKESKKYQVKFLFFMNGQLYCSICKCYATPWNSFVGICEGIDAHFETDAHSALDGEKNHKSGEKLQKTEFSNKRAVTVEAEVPFDPLYPKQTKTANVSDESKQKIENVVLEDISCTPCEALVENPPRSSELLKVNNYSVSSSNQGATTVELDLNPKPVNEEFNVNVHTSNRKSTNSVVINDFAVKPTMLYLPIALKNKKPFPSSMKISKTIQQIDLSFKRLISNTPLVRVNKEFIEQVGENFNCILCSKCIPYSPKKYVLAKNFNSHFKSAAHIAIVNQISKVENVSRISQIFKRNCRKTYRPVKDQTLKTAKKTSLTKPSCDTFEVININPITQSLPNEESENNDSKPNLTNSENKCRRVQKQAALKDFVKVSANKTSALKKFMKKYKVEKGHDMFGNNLSSSMVNKFVSQKPHPLLQKLLPDVPLLLVNQQYIARKSVGFYCTLCCEDIPFSSKNHVLAKYLNAHFKCLTHISLLEAKHSEVEQRQPILSVEHSTDDPSKANPCKPNCTVTQAERGVYNVLSKGKTMFKEVYSILIKYKNEEVFFCDICKKLRNTTPHKSFEHSIIQHCLKSHKGSEKTNDTNIAHVVWVNSVLKANIAFVEIAHQDAACGICCWPLPFSKNYNTLIVNFLVHFQDEKHRQVIRSTKPTKTLPSVGVKSKKYKPNLKAYQANSFI